MTAAAKMAIALAVLLAGALAGWTANGWRLSGQLSDLTAVHAGLVSAANAATAAAVRAGQERYENLVKANAEIDRQQTLALQGERDETQRLRDCVARGTCGVRVAATCPARPANVPGAAADGGLGDAGAPRLTASAERDYFALRDGIALVTRQLLACQEGMRARGG